MTTSTLTLVLSAAALVCASASASIACSAGSASETLRRAPRQNHPMGEGATSDTSPTEPGGADSETADRDADADADADAGDAAVADAGPLPASAFVDAGAFVAQLGPTTLDAAHGNGGNPAKLDCLTAGCHGAGGAGPRFSAGGTVYTSLAATAPAAQVEVRLLDAKGAVVSTHTDANGNFFVRAAGAGALTFPAKTGARTAAATQPMSSPVADGACNSAACHGNAATGVIHVP